MASAANSPGRELKMPLRAPGHPEEVVFVTITADEVMSITDVVDPAVLMYWRTFEAVGQQATAESVWHHMADQGMRDDDAPVIKLQTVLDAVDRLAARGLLSPASGDAE
jgi:hypothetical protein